MEHLFEFKKTTFNISKKKLNDLINIRSIYEYKTKNLCIEKCDKKVNYKNNPCSNCHIKINNEENPCDNCNAKKNPCDNCTSPEINIQAICLRNKKKFRHRFLNSRKTLSTNKKLKLKTSLALLKLNISTSNFRFSELQVKQGLLYYYLCNSQGIIKNLEKKKVAELLKCTVKTVENNNRLFELHNLFETKKDCAGTIFVKIVNYENQYAKGGEGYVVFPTPILNRILNESELRVNELKLLLKSLSKFDYNKKKNQTTKFLINDLMNFTSSRYWNKTPLIKLLNKLNTIFDNLYTAFFTKEGEIKVVMDNELHGETFRNKTLVEHKAKIKLFIDDAKDIFDRSKEYVKAKEEDKNVVLKPNEQRPSTKMAESILDSFGQLSIEYGYNAVQTELSKIPSLEYNSLVNIGGYIRNKIEETFDINKACLGIV